MRNKESPKKAVLWDLDGTLVDSMEYHWSSWRDAMVEDGASVTRDQFLATFGHRNDEILSQWLGPEATVDRIQRIASRKEVLFRKFIRQGGLAPLPGASQWIEKLATAGWQQAIASSAPRENIDTILEVAGLAEKFKAIVSGYDVTIGKPDPQVFLLAASRVGVLPSQCIVVEDAAAGIEGARRAGMRSIGVCSHLSADLVVSSLTDLLPEAFEDLLGRFSGELQPR